MPTSPALAHREGCNSYADHPGSCCICGPGSATCKSTCPNRPEQRITADRLDLAVRYVLSHGPANGTPAGFTDASHEFPRLRTDQARSDIDWGRMEADLRTNQEAALARLAVSQQPIDPPSDDDAPPLDQAPGIPLEKVRRYRELRDGASAAKAEADALKAEADLIEAQLVEAYGEAGMQSVNLDGKTIYLHRTTYAQRLPGVDGDGVKEALRAAGVEELITETVNANTLNAYVRELLDADDAPGLPAPLAEVLELGEKYAIRIKASASRAKR